MGQTALDRPGPRIAGLLRLSHWVSGTPRAAGGNRGRWPCWTCWPPLARVPSLQAAFSHARCLRVRSHPSSCWFMTNKRLCINILFCMLNSFYFCRKEKIEKSKFIIRESQFCMSVGGRCFWMPFRRKSRHRKLEIHPLATGPNALPSLQGACRGQTGSSSGGGVTGLGLCPQQGPGALRVGRWERMWGWGERSLGWGSPLSLSPALGGNFMSGLLAPCLRKAPSGRACWAGCG